MVSIHFTIFSAWSAYALRFSAHGQHTLYDFQRMVSIRFTIFSAWSAYALRFSAHDQHTLYDFQRMVSIRFTIFSAWSAYALRFSAHGQHTLHDFKCMLSRFISFLVPKSSKHIDLDFVKKTRRRIYHAQGYKKRAKIITNFPNSINAIEAKYSGGERQKVEPQNLI